MDFGALSVVGLGHSPTGSAPIHDSNPNDNGSGHTLKHKRSDNEDEGSRPSKLVSRVDDFRAVPLIHQGTPLLQRSSSGGQMLSFSCSSDKQEVCFLSGSSKDGGDGDSKSVPQNLGLSYYHSAASVGCYSRNAGISSGSLNGNMHGSISGIKGPFTPAQWIELEHQALIYKYIVANVPVPSSLLIPIRKALTHSGFPGFSAGSYPAHSFGWGTFHLGFSGNTDPEPGRCRRTDGKKWRCSRDAVPDQKYCERHINRGRHRSRKPVEGHSGQVASGTTHPKVVPSSMSSSVSLSNGGASNNNNNNSLTIAQNHQMKKGLQPPAAPTNSSTDSIANRAQDSQCLSVVTSTVTLKPNPPFSILKQHNPFDDSSQSEFGLISTESLLNPSHKNSYLNCKNYNSFLEYGDQQPQQDQYPLRHFMDDWTQLSMSIPMSSDFSSSSSSPNRDKNALSPLRLSRELDPTHMNLGVGNVSVPWGNSMGGPLGEVLNNAGGGPLGGMAASKGGSSPTGVLQKVTFVSLSNNSSGGSPTKVENKTTHESVSLCDDLLGSTHASASSIPSI